MSAYWKIPLQALVLMIGVLVFVFYLFQAPPLLYNPAHEAEVRAAQATEYSALESRYQDAFTSREAAARAVADARDAGDATTRAQAIGSTITSPRR